MVDPAGSLGPEARAWVEEMALALEALQVPRMGGRILAHLLVCGEPHQSLDALAEALGASKASMSTTARLLTGLGYLEPVPVPGQRRDHYRIRQGAWLEPTRRHAALLARLRQVSEQRPDGGPSGPSEREIQDPDVSAPMGELRECCSSLEIGLREVLAGGPAGDGQAPPGASPR